MEPLGLRLRRALAPWAALALLELAAAAGYSGGDGESPAEQIRPILDDAARPGGSAEAGAHRLAALGAPAVPALVDALVEGDTLSGEQREAILGGLALLDRKTVLAALERLAASRPPERRAVLAVLAHLGSPEELAFALRTAFPDPADPGAPGLDGDLAAAVGAILARHPEDANRIPHLVASSGPTAGAALVRGVGVSGRREGIAALAALLGVVPELERSLISEMGGLAAHLAPPFAEVAKAGVREELDSPDPQIVREAALTAGRLVDDAALPRLVELLDDPRKPISTAALFSLRAITGLALPADAPRWEAWLDAEQAWFDTELAETLEGLASPDRKVALAALREISLRRVRRVELAAEVEPLLRSPHADVCRAACRTLASLGACARLGAVIDCLEDEDGLVAAEAWNTLQVLTGADLPADPEAWRSAWGKTGTVLRHRSSP